jgi:signal transduction histidine kinase
VGLVGWIAALEYHWLDQVSQADREERRATLQAHAEEFATDFDREVSRLHGFLELAGSVVQTGGDPAFAKRYEAWHDAARDPQILRAIYWVRAAKGQNPAGLEEYQPATQSFSPVPWPDALLPLRPALTATRDPLELALGAGPLTLTRNDASASVPAVVAPIALQPSMNRSYGNTFVSVTVSEDSLIAYLDRNYLTTTFLPALAARHFPPRSVDPYRLAVIDPQRPDAPIMTADWPVGTPVDATHADASVAIFTLRPDLTAQIAQRAAISAPRGTGAAIVTGGRSNQSTFRLVVQSDLTGSSTAGTVGAAAAAAPSLRFLSRPPTGWQLVLQHSAGSLDAAVNQARRRNLWLSFGLLSVLAAGVMLIVTNARRAERLATQQMDFVAAVSHELRTPLAVIRSAAQNLSAGLIADPARAKQYGELIEAEGRRLTDMVEQVLDYAGLGGSPRPVAARLVDLSAIAADVLAACQPLATAAGVDLQAEVAPDLPAVMGDEIALRSAVENLVSNALRYGADGRWVRLTLRAADGGVEAIVADRGLGVDAADRPHVFEPFYRGQRAKDTQVHGNGLGLSLVKRIVEAHGGRVRVESTPGAGATFTLVFPAAKASSAADVAAGLDPAAAR